VLNTADSCPSSIDYMQWSLKQSQIQGQRQKMRKTKTSDDHKHCTMQPFDTALGGAQGGHTSMGTRPLRTTPVYSPLAFTQRLHSCVQNYYALATCVYPQNLRTDTVNRFTVQRNVSRLTSQTRSAMPSYATVTATMTTVTQLQSND